MPENVTNELLYAVLQAVQKDLAALRSEMRDLATDVRSMKGHMAAFLTNEVAQDGSIAELRGRIERIERRLELE
jgi:hypothetical protein